MNEYYKNKTAWVTGSSRGLGRCIAEKLAAEGCNVVISGRNQTNLQSSGEGNTLDEVAAEISKKYGVRCIAVCGLLSDEETVKQHLDEIHEKMGRIDYLVCAAGGGNVKTALKMEFSTDYAGDFDLDSVKSMIDHNLIPTMLCCRAVIPDMRENGFGRIITIGSIAGCGGNKNGSDGFAAYSMTKSAVHQYTRLLAKYLRHDGIPVNCIIPGNINTPSTRLRFGGDRAKPVDGLSRLEHVGTPDDIANLAVFLCGPGGEYISGQLIRVDGAEQLSPC